MATLTLRSIKGTPLTISEMDDNFSNLNTDVGNRLLSSNYTAADVLTKIKTVDGTGSGLDADLLDGLNSSTSNTVSTIVARDSSGNFAAGQITATTFVGSMSVPVSGSITLTGSSSGNITLQAPAAAGTNTITFPASTGNVVTTGDTGTVTNTMLAGSIANSKLVNSSITIDGNAVSLGGSINISSSNITWTGSQTFRDNRFTITDDVNTTKAFTFEASGITSGATRTLTIPDASGTIAIGQQVLTTSGVTFASQVISGNSQIASLGVGTSASGTTGEIRATSQVISGNSQIASLGVGTSASGANGEIRATGNIFAFSTSDKNLKENIAVIPNALQKVEKLRGVTFDWTDEEIAKRGGEDGYFIRKNDIGVIAQEVEAVLPEIVATNSNGYKAVKYELIVPLLIEAIKELSDKYESLKGQCK